MSNIISFKQMEKSDIDGVLEVENKSFSIPWSRHSFEKEMENELAYYVIAKCGDDVAGYGGIWFIAGEGHITNIAVHPSSRKKGIGKKILDELISESLKRNVLAMTLEVRVSNEVAIGLYSSYGFKAAGTRPKYYHDNGEDALIMWKELNNEQYSDIGN